MRSGLIKNSVSVSTNIQVLVFCSFCKKVVMRIPSFCWWKWLTFSFSLSALTGLGIRKCWQNQFCSGSNTQPVILTRALNAFGNGWTQGIAAFHSSALKYAPSIHSVVCKCLCCPQGQRGRWSIHCPARGEGSAHPGQSWGFIAFQRQTQTNALT